MSEFETFEEALAVTEDPEQRELLRRMQRDELDSGTAPPREADA